MTMAKYFLPFGFLFGIANDQLLCQTVPIQTDRPDQTECPFIVPAHYIQMEHGLLLENIDDSSAVYTYPLRCGSTA